MIIVAILGPNKFNSPKFDVAVQVWQSCLLVNQVGILYLGSVERGGRVVDWLLDLVLLVLLVIDVPNNFVCGG